MRYGNCATCVFAMKDKNDVLSCFRHPPAVVADGPALWGVYPCIEMSKDVSGCFEYVGLEPLLAVSADGHGLEPVAQPDDESVAKNHPPAPLDDKQAVVIAAWSGMYNICDHESLISFAMERLGLKHRPTIVQLASMSSSLRKLVTTDMVKLLPPGAQKPGEERRK